MEAYICNPMPDETKPGKKEILQPMLFALMMIMGIFIGRKIDESNTPESSVNKPKIIQGTKSISSTLEEAIKFIDARYVDSININHLSEEAIVSLVHELDPFSVYLPSHHQPQDSLKSFTEAYGFHAILDKNSWIVQHITANSPAAMSKLEIGDQLKTMNSKSITQNSFNQWMDTILNLQVIKPIHQSISIRLQRVDVGIRSTVEPVLILPTEIGYIRIRSFGDNTYDEFITAIDSLYNKKNIRDFIFDLRDNAGGYMEECSRMLNQLFTDKNILLATTVGRTVRKAEYKTDGRQLNAIGKIAVIINEHSASASEVFAGALQDLNRAILVGTPSYGKGLVQEQYMLSNGAALRLSVARFYLPSGRTVDYSGVHLDKNKKFFKTDGTPLPYSASIIPDIKINKAANQEIDNQSQIENQLSKGILFLKATGKLNSSIDKLSQDQERKLIQSIPLNPRRLTASQKAVIKNSIAKELLLANKKFTLWEKNEIASLPEVKAATLALSKK